MQLDVACGFRNSKFWGRVPVPGPSDSGYNAVVGESVGYILGWGNPCDIGSVKGVCNACGPQILLLTSYLGGTHLRSSLFRKSRHHPNCKDAFCKKLGSGYPCCCLQEHACMPASRWRLSQASCTYNSGRGVVSKNIEFIVP